MRASEVEASVASWQIHLCSHQKITEHFSQRASDLRRLSLGSAFLGSFFSPGHIDESSVTHSQLQHQTLLSLTYRAQARLTNHSTLLVSESATSWETPSVPGKPGWLVTLVWALRGGMEWCGLHKHTGLGTAPCLPFLAQSGTSRPCKPGETGSDQLTQRRNFLKEYFPFLLCFLF